MKSRQKAAAPKGTKHMNIELKNKFLAGYAGVFLVSYEEKRVEAELLEVASAIGYHVYIWTITDSIVGPLGTDKPQVFKNGDEPYGPVEMLDAIGKVLPAKSIVLAKDYHLFVGEPNPVLVRKMKDCLAEARLQERRLVILGCQFKLCAELEKEFTAIEFALPDRTQLKVVADGIARSAGIALNGHTEELLDAASGLTTIEAEDAFALAAIEADKKEITPAVVAREKSNCVKKNGLLELVHSTVTLDQIGGLERLKKVLYDNRNSFTKAARDYGLPSPRPLLVCGQPGTGKSLTATAVGNVFSVPLLRLEAGRLFGSLVGETERNWRTAFSTMKAIAPACVHIDEVDGLFAGGHSSGQTDGGTTARTLKAILQDLQFNAEGLLFVFTANDIDCLPDPLIDRCDVWSVDLPNEVEREAIWKIHIAKRKRNPENYDSRKLAQATDGFTGRQIEQAWLKAMTIGFNDSVREPTTEDAISASSQMVPTSVTMRTQIEARRKRLEGRAQPAGEQESAEPVGRKGRKL